MSISNVFTKREDNYHVGRNVLVTPASIIALNRLSFAKEIGVKGSKNFMSKKYVYKSVHEEEEDMEFYTWIFF